MKTYYNGDPLLLKITNPSPLYGEPLYNVLRPQRLILEIESENVYSINKNLTTRVWHFCHNLHVFKIYIMELVRKFSLDGIMSFLFLSL